MNLTLDDHVVRLVEWLVNLGVKVYLQLHSDCHKRKPKG